MKMYHYTDINGLLGIIRDRIIWATDIRYLNDSMEYKYGLERYNQVLNSRSDKDKHIIVPSDYTRYAICFSELADLLSQWRAYSKDGYGYCIGFQSDSLLSDIEETVFFPKFGEVLYDEDRIDKYINMELDTIDQKFLDFQSRAIRLAEYQANKLEKKQSESDSDFDTRKHYTIFKPMEKYAYRESVQRLQDIREDIIGFCKALGFSEEKEFRILLSLLDNRLLKFRNRGGILVPYIEIHLQNKIKDLITEIYIGPNLDFEMAKGSLIRQLNNLEIYIDPSLIIKSNVPYRT